MPWIEKEGRSVEEAKAAAIAEAGRAEEDLEIEVIREGAKGLFGLGGEPAVVRVRPKEEARDVRSAFQDDLGSGTSTETTIAPEREPAREEARPREREADREAPEGEGPSDDERHEAAQAVGAEMVKGVLERMGLDGDVTTRVLDGTVYVEVSGEDMGILIGRGGATLEALQEVVRAGVRRKVKARQPVVVDVESYWERKRGRRGRGGRDDDD